MLRRELASKSVSVRSLHKGKEDLVKKEEVCNVRIGMVVTGNQIKAN